MNNTPETRESRADGFLWALVALLLVGGIVANYYFAKVAIALRLAGWVVLLCVVGALAFQTSQGAHAWEFAQGARAELRKVTWPTRETTVQTTMVIAAIVVVMAVILWGFDSILLWAIGWLTGQRG